ncbi:MAG TPA: DNA alkylation repair protein [Microscillaceae bacterium]|nr:DNA alkylation repair protein [Microscillaceae bacterium]
METQPFVEKVVALFKSHADAPTADGMTAYMRHQFVFLGIKRPLRSQLQKTLWTLLPPQPATAWLGQTAEALWQLEAREYQYFAIDLLDRYKKQLTPEMLPTLEKMVVQQAWWDTVDLIASHLFGALVAAHPALLPQMDAYAQHTNLWLRRVAILYQLHYKQATDFERLQRYCLSNAADPDFFIRKAIGWALRQYARVAPEAVQVFVQTHSDRLSTLSRQEALKHLG